MSLSYLRDNIHKRLQEMTDALAQRAIDMRVHSGMSADQYALVQVDTLAEARALATAARVVADEYKKMIEPEKTEVAAPEKPVSLKEAVYG